MNKFRRVTSVGVLSITLMILYSLVPGITPDLTAQEPSEIPVIEGPVLVVVADPTAAPYYVPPPDHIGKVGVQAMSITANFNPATCAGTVTPWTAQAQTAFNHALGIWAGLLNGSQPIVVDACYRTDMGGTTLGSAGANGFLLGGVPNSWYPRPLAHELAGSDLNGTGPGNAEIVANFNANFGWYYGTDGNPGAGEYDFVSVVLHEVGHGLGFGGSMVVDDGNPGAGYGTECNNTLGVGCWGQGTGFPFIYDRFSEDGNGVSLINTTSYPQNSLALGSALTGNVGSGIYFDGTNANAANGGSRVKLYSPGTWNFGSSYSHLDEIFNSTPHALMTYSLGSGTAIHNPGSVTLGLFQDIGWTLQPTGSYKVYLPLIIRNM